MNYRDHLNRWAIARLSPDKQWTIIARFRTWADAEGYLMTLRQQHPRTPFKVTFSLVEEPPQEASSCLDADAPR